MMRRCLLAIALFLSLPLFEAAADNVQFRHITEKQGLKHTWIQHITKDSKGYMWFSTIYGAYRYDGFVFEEYRFEMGEDGLVAKVNFVFEDSSGDLWFGTNDGLWRLDPVKGTEIHYTKGRYSPLRLSSSHVNDMLEDSSGNLWVAGDGGVDMLGKNTSVRNYETGNTGAVMMDSRYNIWIGTVGGKVMRLDASLNDFVPVNLPVHADVRDLFQDSHSNIWISTLEGLVRYSLQHGGTECWTASQGELPNDFVRQVTEDMDGNIWVATEHGLVKFSEGRREFVTSHRDDIWSLNDNAVYSMYCDEEGNLWVGTFFGGINVMFRHFDMFDFLLAGSEEYSAESKVVSSIVHVDGNLFVGTENDGVYVFDGSSYMPSSHISTQNSSLGSDNIHSICVDAYGNLWLGSYYGGLYMKTRGGHAYRSFKAGGAGGRELTSNNIYSVYSDSRGNLWVGTQYGGLYRYDYASGMLKHFPEELPENLFVWDIHEDRVGDIWLACHGSGVWRLSSENGYAPEKVETDGKLFVTLCELEDGRILAGTEKEGLARIDPKTLASEMIKVGDGLPDNTIYGILQDDDGNVWLSTNTGLYRTGTSFSTYTNYTIADGLSANRFNYNACARHEGRLYFGCINGVVVVDPHKEVHVDINRPIRFNSLYINSIKQEISEGGVLSVDINELDVLELKHWQNTFGLDFTGNIFGCDNGHRFAYRMQGIDESWHMLGSRNKVDFIGLKPGTYTLMVAGVDDNEVLDNVASLKIRIRPVWWQSMVAKICLVLMVCLIVLWLASLFFQSTKHRHELELEKLAREKDKEINEQKFRFFVNVSHEFKTPLSLILGPVEQFMNGRVSPEMHGKYFSIIKKNADKLLALVNELLAFRELQFTTLNTTSVNVSSVVEAVLSRYEWLFGEKEISLEVDVPSDMVISADSVKFEKILDNLLSNAYKHTSRGDKVMLKAVRRQDSVFMTIEDTGEGIPEDKLPHIFERFFTSRSYDMYSSGVGLSYVKSLVEQHGGSISAFSEVGRFTRFELELPVTPAENAVHSSESDEEYRKECEKMHRMEVEPVVEDIDKEEYRRLAAETVLLIVEDDHSMRELLVDHFGRRYSVLSADNGELAAKIVHETKVDIVLSDVMLAGGMSGFDLCHFIRNSVETSHIKVVLMTVLSEQDYKFQGYHAGADAYVTKPFAFSLLELRIRNLLLNTYRMRESYKIEIDVSNVEVKASNTDEQFIRKIVDVIFTHLSESEFSVDDLCQQVGMSKATLYRKLKAITGQSTNEFMQNTRLKYAARLLTETDRSVADVAYEVGFSDPYYFSRAFKKLFGRSPKQWRQGSSEENAGN